MSELSRFSQGTLARWAAEYLLAPAMASRFAIAPPPREDTGATDAPLRVSAPVRDATVRARAKGDRKGLKRPTAQALRDGAKRAELLHTLLHHELQAAELFCWAILAFPEAPSALRAGFARVVVDEVRHMNAYAERITALGYTYGDFAIRDWFWERVPASRTVVQFLSVVGLGFEGANLDHAARLAAMFREAGDEASARVQELVQREEISHVHLARTWFERLVGAFSATLFARELPPPLTPWVLRGTPIDREARARAGLDADFLDAIEAWTERGPGF